MSSHCQCRATEIVGQFAAGSGCVVLVDLFVDDCYFEIWFHEVTNSLKPDLTSFSRSFALNSGVVSSGLFVTGTDTAVGKTHVAVQILRELAARGIKAGAYKPVCSGAHHGPGNEVTWDDVERLRGALSDTWTVDEVSPQRFLAPVAPPLAARLEGREVDFQKAVQGARWWDGRVDLLVVEGAGGLLAPVSASEFVADLAREIGFPLVIVARCGLGTINHTLLTIEAAKHRGLTVAGIILNQSHPNDDYSLAESNAAEIESRGGCPVLGVLKWGVSDGLQRHGCPVTIAWTELARTY